MPKKRCVALRLSLAATIIGIKRSKFIHYFKKKWKRKKTIFLLFSFVIIEKLKIFSKASSS